MLVGLVLAVAVAVAPSAGLSKVRAISFDVTGTLITHGQPVMKSYADAAVWARLPNPPTAEELKPAFKQAYKDALEESPCFGGRHGTSGRDWWRMTIRRVLAISRPDTSYTEEEFDRYFRRVYQHFMSPKGYERLEDADTFLSWAESDAPELLLGITSNTPTRHSASHDTTTPSSLFSLLSASRTDTADFFIAHTRSSLSSRSGQRVAYAWPPRPLQVVHVLSRCGS